MNRFKEIDAAIKHCAKLLNAKLTKDRPGYPETLRTFEERRIDWVENGINKSILIQPHFENTGVNHHLWNFINVAWYNARKNPHALSWRKNLITAKEFTFIEHAIDRLLSESIHHLKAIQMQDLK